MGERQREVTAPDWLNNNYLQNVLQKSFKNKDLEVLNSDIKIATAAAENYASQIFRIVLTLKTTKDGKKENLTVLVKLISPGKLGEELEKFQAYEKEEDAFANILPALHDVLQRAYPDHKKLWAECYYHERQPNYILMLEDLRVSGYVLASRFEGLDMEHTLLVLKSLAKLHASSLVLHKEKPKLLESYWENCWQPKNAEFMNNMISYPFKIMSEDILQWPECDKKEIYSKKLKALETTALGKTFEMWNVDKSKLNVLLHGDSWLNNFMFKYDPNGKLSGINFVDFQMMNINSPAMDLQYFIFTSVNPNLRFTCVDLFLQTYHEAFVETLKQLNFELDKPYTLEQLKKDFDEKYFWGLTVFCVIFPVFLVPADEAIHPDEFIEPSKNERYAGVYKRKSMRDTLVKGFKYFEEKGVF